MFKKSMGAVSTIQLALTILPTLSNAKTDFDNSKIFEQMTSHRSKKFNELSPEQKIQKIEENLALISEVKSGLSKANKIKFKDTTGFRIAEGTVGGILAASSFAYGFKRIYPEIKMPEAVVEISPAKEKIDVAKLETQIEGLKKELNILPNSDLAEIQIVAKRLVELENAEERLSSFKASIRKNENRVTDLLARKQVALRQIKQLSERAASRKGANPRQMTALKMAREGASWFSQEIQRTESTGAILRKDLSNFEKLVDEKRALLEQLTKLKETHLARVQIPAASAESTSVIEIKAPEVVAETTSLRTKIGGLFSPKVINATLIVGAVFGSALAAHAVFQPDGSAIVTDEEKAHIESVMNGIEAELQAMRAKISEI